jgi:hypothetical protein
MRGFGKFTLLLLVLFLETRCSNTSKEVNRREFQFIIMVEDAKEISYSPIEKKAFLSLNDQAIINARYKEDLGHKLYNAPQYSTSIKSSEEYEMMMDSLLSKLRSKYLIKKGDKFELAP